MLHGLNEIHTAPYKDIEFPLSSTGLDSSFVINRREAII